MAQQPNIELDPADRPRAVPTPDAARRWQPSMRPGMITSPDQVPRGEGYGNPGPDAGWAFRLIDAADVPDLTDALRRLLAAFMTARAASFGRAPTVEDLEVALLLCGIGDALPEALAQRRERWLDAMSHDKPPGRTALSEVGMDLLRHKPAEVRLRVSRSE
ncbi:MAG: hypothetical protein R3246_04420 [Acidimicrobiia bacterium]|nr:hypothetical protein [Acidimicrobiia bacterium]